MEKDDAELIALFKAGDEHALALLIKKHVKSVYNFAFRLLGDTTLAEDTTQETFIKAWKNLDRFRVNESFHAWLFTIARNTATDHLRKKRTLPFSRLFGQTDDGETAQFEDTLIDTDPTPEELAIIREQKEFLDDALDKIPPLYREVLLLYYNEDLTFNEIGGVLGKPLNTVKSQYRRALMALRNVIEKPE